MTTESSFTTDFHPYEFATADGLRELQHEQSLQQLSALGIFGAVEADASRRRSVAALAGNAVIGSTAEVTARIGNEFGGSIVEVFRGAGL